MYNRSSIIVLVGAIVAVLAQIIIAPNIVVFSAMPNFIVAYVLVIAMVRPTDSVLVLAFVLGILFDLLGYGPIGGLALFLTLAAFIVMRIFRVIDLDNLFMPIVVFVGSVVVIELLYSVLLVVLGLSSDFLSALVYRTLPSVLLECIVGLIFYPILLRLLSRGPDREAAQLSQPEFKRPSRKSGRYR